jgi:integrase
MSYLKEKEITQPSALKREHIDQYFDWRKRRKGGRNTAIHEIKFLKQVMDEAVRRGYANANPASNLKLKKSVQKEKSVWSDEEISLVMGELEQRDKFGWMHVSFLMGLYQAVRLRQSQVPISRIDFRRRLITYPGIIVKGGRPFSHPIDPDFYPILEKLVEYRRRQGKSNICDIPEGKGATPPSVLWRQFLTEFGLPHLSHHGLRATWITRAALAGINEAQARRFVNHASTQVHQIYQKIQSDDLLPMLDAFALARQRKKALPNM